MNQKLVDKLTSQVWKCDARDLIPKIPKDLIQCVVTSPPYWGKRWYPLPKSTFGGDPDCDHHWVTGYRCPTKMGIIGSTDVKKNKEVVDEELAPDSAFCVDCGIWEGWLGQEPHPQLYILNLVRIFRLIHEVGRDDMTLWVNLGDTYAGSVNGKLPAGYKDKDLMMIPSQFARAMAQPWYTCDVCKVEFHESQLGITWSTIYDKIPHCPNCHSFAAMQQTFPGWYNRSEIIWDKPSPLPDWGKDRPQKTHEQIYLFAKSKRYYYDNDAIRVPYSESSLSRYNYEFNPDIPSVKDTHNPVLKEGGKIDPNPHGKNIGSVWRIGTSNTTVDHSAAFSEDLVTDPIKAGSSRTVCPYCYAPWQRVLSKGVEDEEWQKRCGADAYGGYEGKSGKSGGGQDAGETKDRILKSLKKRETLGWVPTCKCYEHVDNDGVFEGDKRGSVVFDPFGGTGTTAVVAAKLGRRFITCDMSGKYCKIAEARLLDIINQESLEDMRW